ncbi:MAG TPA: CaiB/BaiF CoA-transferase family protein [Gammaproteobacteria bacterium]|nr:CaiB/BaiF CoA-transferase family protein [Gammaproteobacteria bacterium]
MGPLQGLRIVELAGIGPGPFCAMMLADMGAEVVRVDRKSAAGSGSANDVMNRGRRSIALDLKKPEGIGACLKLIDQADALLEGFRPGVMERLGLGPEVCLERNPRLVYGRMTGWGQHGPLAHAAGHDINYISLSGALHAIGLPDKPVPPLNLVGDFGGGAMMLAFGLACGLVEAQRSGKGQVVDAAMTDGSAMLMAIFYGMKASGFWSNERGRNMLDGGAHFYDTYQCKDGRWISIGSIEPKFYALLREKCGLDDDPAFDVQMEPRQWPELKARLAEVIASKTRDEWCELMEGSDVCFAPVLDLDEAPRHPHNRARRAFVELDGVTQPAPAPRFSRTRPEIQGGPPKVGQHTREVLGDWGFDGSAIERLQRAGAI